MNNLKLGDCCLSISDGDHMPPPKAENGIPFVTISDIDNNNTINFTNTMFVPKSYWEQIDMKRKPSPGDVLYTVTGSYGIPVYIESNKDFVFQRHIAILRPNKTLLSGKFLYYLLKNPCTKLYVDKLVTGAIQKTLGLELIRNMSFDVPGIDTQNQIVDVLSRIDNNIKNNISISNTLECLARDIYNYWFVQFDFPDENGKPYKSSGGKMVWNEELKREIPEGWEVKPLSEVFEITMGSSPKGESLNEIGDGIEFYQGSTDFGEMYPTIRVYTNSPVRFAKAQDILLSVRAPVGDMNIAMNDCCIGRGLAAIHHKSTVFAYCTLNSFKPFFDVFNGSGTTFGALTSEDLKGQLMAVPPREVLDSFMEITNPFGNDLRTIAIGNRQLACLRDFLLPMLMNGQVKVV